MRTAVLIGSLLLALSAIGSAYAGPSEDVDCDRSGDHKVTTIDALIALDDAVNNCRTSVECDSDGDASQTAADALVLLRYAVDLPAELQCYCAYIDQCIHGADDEDCAQEGFPGYHCFGSICVECISDEDCEDGYVCDLCRRNCVPDSQ